MLQSVFIVDDDEITIKICNLVIANTEFAKNVSSFINGRECINFFSDYFERKRNGEVTDLPPTLIFLDLNMPVMNGWEFLEDFVRKYAERLPEVKIVILSTSVDPRDFMKAQQYDIVLDFFNKPLTTELINELKEHEEFEAFFA